MDRLFRPTGNLQKQKHKIQVDMFENIFETEGHEHWGRMPTH